MNSNEKTELMICIITNFMRYNGSLKDELVEAIQDCGFSDREIMDITRRAVDRHREENGKA